MCVRVCVPVPRLLIISGVIWTPYDQLNKFYSFYMAAIVVSLIGVAFELKCVIEINLIRVSWCCSISH